MGIWDSGLQIGEYPMIKDLSWLKMISSYIRILNFITNLYPNGAAKAQNIPKYPPEYPHAPD